MGASALTVVLIVALIRVLAGPSWLHRKPQGAPPASIEVASAAVLDGGFTNHTFVGLMSAEVGLMMGASQSSQWYAGYDADYEQAYADGKAWEYAADGCEGKADCEPQESPRFDLYWAEDGLLEGQMDGWMDGRQDSYGSRRTPQPEASAVAVAGFDTTTGQRLWQVDLYASGGLPADEQHTETKAWLNGDGTATCWIALSRGDGGALVTVDTAGQVVSHARIGAPAAESYFGIVLTNTVDEAGLTAAWEARSSAALGSVLWRADAGRGETLIHLPSETCWVSTAAGFADCASGQLIGFGEGASSYEYHMAPTGEELVVLRLQLESFSRVEPSSGQDLWSVPYPRTVATPSLISGFAEGVALFELLGEASQPRLAAVDLATGELIWESQARDFRIPFAYLTTERAAGSYVVALADGRRASPMVALDSRTGQELARFDPEEVGAVPYLAADQFYTYTITETELTLRAFSVTDGAKLWELPTQLSPDFDSIMASCSVQYDRLWCVTGQQTGVQDALTVRVFQ
jgi:outer membrane protein assembly factor BamB